MTDTKPLDKKIFTLAESLELPNEKLIRAKYVAEAIQRLIKELTYVKMNDTTGEIAEKIVIREAIDKIFGKELTGGKG